MKRILTSFPGRFGDLIWALPTVRAISETYGEPVDLYIAGEFGGIAPLLKLQPYIDEVMADPSWSLSDDWRPPHFSSAGYDHVYHLGYRRWPELPLPIEIFQTSLIEHEWVSPLDLTRPWITPPSRLSKAAQVDFYGEGPKIAVGFTECHFELKYGLLSLLREHDRDWSLATCMGPTGRWGEEAGEGMCNWLEAAACISQADLFFGDCAALHVLAVAMNRPCVIVEPMEARLNPIFWALGKDGPQVTLVRGLDHKATFDARHCAEVLENALSRVHA
jgi:hypothetical protein